MLDGDVDGISVGRGVGLKVGAGVGALKRTRKKRNNEQKETTRNVVLIGSFDDLR